MRRAVVAVAMGLLAPILVLPSSGGRAVAATQSKALTLAAYSKTIKPGQTEVLQVTAPAKSHCRVVLTHAKTKTTRAKKVTSSVGKSASGIAQFYWKVPAKSLGGKWAFTVGCGAKRTAVAQGHYTKTAHGTIKVTHAANKAKSNIASKVKFTALGAGQVPTTGLGAGETCAPYGTMRIPADGWLSGKGVTVYSNGSTNGSCYNLSNKYQCVELVNRLVTTLGWSTTIPGNANALYGNASTTYFDKHGNGSGYLPVQGDIVVWGGGIGGYGHVAVVESDTSGLVTVVQQNASASGYGTYRIDGNGKIANNGSYYVEGYLHAKANTTGTAGGSSTGVPPASGVNPSGTFQFSSWVDSGGSLRLSHWTGSAWQNDNFGLGVKAGTSPSAYLGPSGTHFIAWVDNTGSLRLSHWTGSAWQHDNFGMGVAPGSSPSAFAGSNGNPFIAWVDNTGSLRLSHWTGSTWQHDNFGLGVEPGTSPSAYLGANGTLWIAWVDNTGSLRLSHWTGSAWQHDNFGMGAKSGSSPSAYVGPNGTLWIAWVDNTGALRFSHWTGSAWQHDTLASGVRASTSPSAYLGAKGTHFVSWVDSGGSLRLSHWTGSTWQHDNFGAAVAASSSPSAYLG